MKKTIAPILLLCALGIGSEVYSQQRSDIRWKEFKRLGADSTEIEFTDTIKINTTDQVTFDLLKNGLALRKQVEEGKLDFGNSVFEVVSLDKDEMRFKSGNHIHILNRDFMNMAHADAPAKMNELKLPTETIQEFSFTGLTGKWKTYKRVNRNGNKVTIPQNQLLNKIEIAEDPIMQIFHSKNNYEPYLILKSKENGKLLFVNSEGNEVELKVFRMDAEEIVLEDAHEMVYYFIKYD